MFAIGLKEFKVLFKSIRSILIVFIIIGISTGTAKILSQFSNQFDSLGLNENAYVGGINGFTFYCRSTFYHKSRS